MAPRSSETLDHTQAEETSCPLELLDQMQAMLHSVDEGSNHLTADDVATRLESVGKSLSELRAAVQNQFSRVTDMELRSSALAEAQANAIIRSAEMIDELEQTKRELSEARRVAEFTAQDTQRFADAVFDRTNDGILVFRGSTCVACNAKAANMLGSTQQELVDGWPESLVTAERDDESRTPVDLHKLVSQANRDQLVVERVRLHAGGDHWFWAELTISRFQKQQIDHVLVIVRDVTVRMNFERELRRHRDFLNNIINSVPDQLAVKSPDGTLVVVNDAFCRARKLKRQEVLGKFAEELKPAEEPAAESYPSCHHRLLPVDEQPTTVPRTFSEKRSVFHDERGDRYTVSTSRDVTKERIREDRLRLLASVFKGASEGVAILSPFGEILEANPAFAEMSCTSQRALVGKLFIDTLRFDNSDFTQTLRDVSCGEAWSGKARGLEKGSEIRSYWVSLSPSPDLAGRSAPIIALVSDISELENTQAKLRQQAYFDNLTGLPNRRYFREHLTRELVRSDSPLSICFVDLDDFKNVNDSAGHSVGDRLLKAVALRVQSVVGEEAVVARFGGDEFAIIDAKPPAEVDATLNRLLKEFREPFSLKGTEANVGLSIGVTRYPEDGNDVDTLMSNADIAMYAAKSAGKSQIRRFAPEMQNRVNLRTEVQTRLRRALSVGEVSLWYQPKWSVAHNKPQGCEALVRWRTPSGKYVSPGDFVPIAEQTGLILPLGDLVFELAAQQAHEWASQGTVPDIAVNVSPQQIRHPRFVERLMVTLEDAKASPSWFELEITEYAVMDDVEHAAGIITELNELGFRLAIDDFGTGYSSLSYIKSFRLDTLKIDMSFVRDVAADKSSQAVVQSIVSLGRGLNMAVVGEGVETREQFDVLSAIGCTMLQGYHIGKPAPPEEYMAWLAYKSRSHDDTLRC